jgi:hypothetical protein
VIATYVKRLSRSRRKRGVGGKVKRFCRERARGTKTCGRDEDGLGGTVGSDLARRFGLGVFSILNAPKDLLTSCARGGGECFLPRNKLASRTWAPLASNSSGGKRCFVHASGPVRLTRNERPKLFSHKLLL